MLFGQNQLAGEWVAFNSSNKLILPWLFSVGVFQMGWEKSAPRVSLNFGASRKRFHHRELCGQKWTFARGL